MRSGSPGPLQPYGKFAAKNQKLRRDAAVQAILENAGPAAIREAVEHCKERLKELKPERADAFEEKFAISKTRQDADNLTYFTGEMLTILTSELIRAEYEPTDASMFLNLLPIEEPFADEFVWHQADGVGDALRGANFHNNSDIPNVEAFLQRRSSNFLYNFIKYSWTLKDARMPSSLINQLVEKQMLAREILNRDADDFHLFGDSRFSRPDGSSMLGLFNSVYNSSTRPDGIQLLSTTAAPIGSTNLTGGWLAKLVGGSATNTTRDQVVADFYLIDRIFTERYNRGNGQQATALDSVILPERIFAATGWSRFDGDKDVTVKRILQESMPGLQNVYFHRDLNTLGAGSTGRALFYNKAELGNFIHPIPYEEMPVETNTFAYDVHAFGVMGPLVVKRPMAGLYVDGI